MQEIPQSFDEFDLSTYAHQQQVDSLTKWTLNPHDVLENLEMQMRGLKVQNKQLVSYRAPMMNDEGIGRVIMVLDGLINKNNVLGNIQKEEAYKIVRKVSTECNAMFFVNRKTWALSRTDWKVLNMLIQNQVFLFLTRPVGGSERRRLSNVQYRDSPGFGGEQPYATAQPQQKPGLFSKMFKRNPEPQQGFDQQGGGMYG